MASNLIVKIYVLLNIYVIFIWSNLDQSIMLTSIFGGTDTTLAIPFSRYSLVLEISRCFMLVVDKDLHELLFFSFYGGSCVYYFPIN